MAMNNTYKALLSTALNSAGYFVGLSSLAISALNNPYIGLLMPSYIVLSSYFSEIMESTLGKQFSQYASIFDPTNALNIVLVRPHIKSTIDVLEYISGDDGIVYKGDTEIIKGLMYDRNAAALTSAGTTKDLMRAYTNFNLTEYSIFHEEQNEKQSLSLNSGTSALLKYSIIFSCRELIPSSAFIGRNDLCAGIGEGGILAINLFLDDKYSLDSIVARSAFEFVAYDSADRSRSFTLKQFASSESVTDFQVFLSELVYGITINSYRMMRPYVEDQIKENIKYVSDTFYDFQEEYPYYVNDLLYSFIDLKYDDIICNQEPDY